MSTSLAFAPEPNPTVTISTGDSDDALLVNVVGGGLGVADLVVNIVIALATVVALIWTVTSALRALREASEEKRLLREADRRKQGEHIAAWESIDVAWERIDADATKGLDLDVPFRPVSARRTVSVVNSSGQPIYDVRIEYVDHSSSQGFNIVDFAVLPPTQTPKVLSQNVEHRDDWREGEHGLSITFRDAANNYWRRREDGTLEETHRNGRPLTGRAAAASEREVC